MDVALAGITKGLEDGHCAANGMCMQLAVVAMITTVCIP